MFLIYKDSFFQSFYSILDNPTFLVHLIVWFCSSILIISVLVDFVLYEENTNTKNELKSKVATGNMFWFFAIIYAVLIFNIGKISISFPSILDILWIIIVIISTITNIVWRFYLSNNWANHIKIYNTHTLIIIWPYKIVRHPLYASLIWFCYWIGFVYSNWLIFVLNTVVFIPMMIYRAKQEEKMLKERFVDYTKYKEKVWMFFPKIF